MRYLLTLLLASSTFAQVDGQTTGPLELWVAENGSDGHTCLYNYVPCRSLQGAIDKLPRDIRHPVTIYLGAGRFAGAQIHSFTIGLGADKNQLGAFLTIQGQFKDAAISGTQSGAVSSTTDGNATTAVYATLTRTGAGWATNALRGLMLEYTQTNGTVVRRIIDSNTEDTITLLTVFTSTTRPSVNSTFRILDWATIIDQAQPNVRSSPTIAPSNARTGGYINIQNYGNGTLSSRIYIQRIKFINNISAQSASIAGLSDGAGIVLAENNFDYTQLTGSGANTITGSYDNLTIQHSYFKGRNTVNPNSSPSCEFVSVTTYKTFFVGNNLFVGCSVAVRNASRSANYSFNSSYEVSDGMLVTEGAEGAHVFGTNRCDCGGVADDTSCIRGTTNVSRGRWQITSGFVMNGCRRAIYVVGDQPIIITGTVTGSNHEYGIVNGWGQSKITVSSATLLQTRTGTCEILLRNQCLNFADLQNFRTYTEHNWVDTIEQTGPTTVYGGKPASTVGNAVAPGTYDPANLIQCNALTRGAMVYNDTGASRLCICKQDGSAPPVYQWCSLPIATGGAINCAGGTTTVCP